MKIPALKNTLRMGAKVFSGRLNDRIRALTVEFAVSYKCNLNCPYCELDIFGEGRQEKELSAAQIGEVFAKLEAMGVERINISGGEPLLRSDIAEVLRSAYARSFQVDLTTNAVLVPQYLEDLTGLDSLIVSLDGRQETHDTIRGKGVYLSALKAVEMSRQKGIKVILSAVITRHTRSEDLNHLLELAEHFGLECIFQPMTCGVYRYDEWIGFKNAEGLMPSEEQLRELSVRIEKDPRRQRIIGAGYYLERVLRLRQQDRQANKYPCVAGKLFFCITPSGKILPCSMRYDDSFEKNILEYRTEELKRKVISRLRCGGCSCYAYMVLNGLASGDPQTISHCLARNLFARNTAEAEGERKR